VSDEILATPRLALKSTAGRVALFAAVAASGMASLDASVVYVALPRIGHDFAAGLSSTQWVLTGYLLALASLILLGGALGDRYGRRKVFIVGTVWFGVASVLCGAAPNIAVLVGARFLEGCGAALLTPGSLAVLQASFRREDRARAIASWSALSGAAGAVGPFIGGWLVDGPGWRWAFFVNVPVAAVAVASLRAVPETRDPNRERRLDFAGAGLAAASLAAATWVLTKAGVVGWLDGRVVAGCVLVASTGVMFVRRVMHAPGALVPSFLFRSRAFTVTNLQTVMLYGALGVAFLVVPYELEAGAGWSALLAGTALLPATILMLLLSQRSGALAQRIGPRAQLSVGPLLTGGGLLLLTRVGPRVTWWADVLPGGIVFGLGLATFVAPLTTTVIGSVEPEHIGVASAVNNAVARTASLTALAVVPAAVGLSNATGAAGLTSSYRAALVVTALLAISAAPLGLVGLTAGTRTMRSARGLHCAVDGPPLHPDAVGCEAQRLVALRATDSSTPLAHVVREGGRLGGAVARLHFRAAQSSD
jgi:EmrB/QacA subfamily drug resistance transporter